MIHYYLYFTWEYIYIYIYIYIYNYYLFLLELKFVFTSCWHIVTFHIMTPHSDCSAAEVKRFIPVTVLMISATVWSFIFFHNFGSNNWCQACQEQLFSSYAWACVFPLICQIYSEKGPCLWSAIMDLSITSWEDEDYSGPVGLWVVWSMTSYPLPIQTH